MSRHPTSQRSTRAWLLAVMAAGSAVVNASSPPLPDEFLEYLGSWEADDADWLVANATNQRAAAVSATTGNPAVAPAGASQPATRSTTAPRDATTAQGTEPKP